jgi:tellurite resistance protein
MFHVTHPLKYLLPGCYAFVMGLCGLALAWFRATPLMGEAATAVAAVIAGLAALVFAVLAVLAVATVLRARRHPQAWVEDRRHPVRPTQVAALPISLILLASLATLTLRLATPGGALAVLGLLLLAVSSLVVLALVMGTMRGLHEGTLLAPETLASIQPLAVG